MMKDGEDERQTVEKEPVFLLQDLKNLKTAWPG